jgi:hypothetical protein
MHLVALALVVAGSLLLLWAVQSVLLWFHHQPLALPARYQTELPGVRYPMKLMVQLFWASILIVYPSIVGPGPFAYFSAAFAPPPPWKTMASMAAVTLAGFVLVNLIGSWSGIVEVKARYSLPRSIRKVLGCVLTAVPLAIFEEAVFRGVGLAALLADFPKSSTAEAIAIVLASAVFASVHVIRRQRPEKAVLQPVIGLFFVGATLGTAYLACGQRLWLPIAMHAAGIFGVEAMRPFVVYQDQHSLWVGHRSTPHSGLLGISIMLGLCLLLAINR